ncbi:MAG: TlyA family RNA methyltransferase [Christensenellaceae bacterium]
MRIDEFLFTKGFFDSRTKAKQAIERGDVFYDDRKVLKASAYVSEDDTAKIEIKDGEYFVSLGGYKLSKALKDFGFSVEGLTVADVGASTGGFTDCLIKNGAKQVYAVDLNDDLLHESLKNNEKVVRIIKNARNLTATDFSGLDLITADLSFISAKQVLSVFYNLLPESGKIILLIKPQFEIGEKRRFKNGIIKDEKTVKSVCRSVYEEAVKVGFSAIDLTDAPRSEDKNTEYLIFLRKDGKNGVDFEKLYKF